MELEKVKYIYVMLIDFNLWLYITFYIFVFLLGLAGIFYGIGKNGSNAFLQFIEIIIIVLWACTTFLISMLHIPPNYCEHNCPDRITTSSVLIAFVFITNIGYPYLVIKVLPKFFKIEI